MSLLSCKPPKTTCGSGEGGEHVKLPKGLFYNSFFRRFTSNIGASSELGFEIQYESINGTPQMTYRIGECGGSFTTSKGILTSPSYPRYYPNDADCFYTVSQPNGTYVSISFLTMDIDCSDTQPIQPIQGRSMYIVG